MFSSEQKYPGLVILDYREAKIQRYRQVGGICISETGIIFDGRTDTRLGVGKH